MARTRGPRKLTIKKVEDAIEDSMGIKQVIAQRCGVSRKSIYDFFEKHPHLEHLANLDKDKIVDMAEVALVDGVKKQEWNAVNKVLSTLGKNRGYIEKQEIEHIGNDAPTLIKIIKDDGKGDRDQAESETV